MEVAELNERRVGREQSDTSVGAGDRRERLNRDPVPASLWKLVGVHLHDGAGGVEPRVPSISKLERSRKVDGPRPFMRFELELTLDGDNRTFVLENDALSHEPGTGRMKHALEHHAIVPMRDRAVGHPRRQLDRVGHVAAGSGWREESTGLHPLEFIETRRHWFTAAVEHDTRGTVNVLNLVEGAAASLERPVDAFEP